MENEFIIVLVLIGLLIAQQLFYSWQMHKLTDKLMSRNYVDYIQAQNLKKPKKNAENEFNIKEDRTERVQAIQQAQEMNRLMEI